MEFLWEDIPPLLFLSLSLSLPLFFSLTDLPHYFVKQTISDTLLYRESSIYSPFILNINT
jgi:hypothetical protein